MTDDDKAREIACRYTDGQGYYDLVDAIIAALREARQQDPATAAESHATKRTDTVA